MFFQQRVAPKEQHHLPPHHHHDPPTSLTPIMSSNDPIVHSPPGDNVQRVLKAKPHGVLMGRRNSQTDKHMVTQAKIGRNIIFPWMRLYQLWWDLTCLASIFTVFFEPYQIAFQNPDNDGTGTVAASMVEHIMTVLFALDTVLNFNLAYYENEEIVFERKRIVQSYCRRMFWIDFIGWFPFTNVILAATGELGSTSNKALLISLLRLLRLVRLHRMMPLQDLLQYSSKISLMWFTLLRNFFVALVVTHFAACVMYLLARLKDFGEDTWLGPLVNDMNGVERYVSSLYWSVGTYNSSCYRRGRRLV